MQPWRMMAAQSSALAGLPLLLWRPWLPAPAQAAVRDLTRAFAAGAELVERCTRRFGKPEFVIPGLVERVAVEKPFCRLLHFVGPGGEEKPKVLLVAPMSGHHATLLDDREAP